MRAILLLVLFVFSTMSLHAQEEVIPDAATLYDSMLVRDFSELVSRPLFQPFSKGEKFNEENLKVSSTIGNHKAAGVAAHNLGWIAMRKKEYESALGYFRRALEEFRRGNAERGMAGAYGQIGMVQQLMGNLSEARTSYQEALKIMEKKGMSRGAAVVTNALAQIYSTQKEHGKSLGYYRLALKTFTGLQDIAGISESNLRIGEELIKLSRDEEAVPFLKRALLEKTALGDKHGQSDVLRDLGIVEYRKGNYEQSIRQFEASLQSWEQLPVLKLVRDAYRKLAVNSEVNGEENKKKEYNRQYHLYKDSVENLLASRALSPDSFAKEQSEKEKISDLVTRQKEFQLKNLDAQQIERNRKITEVELESLKKEEYVTELNRERELHEEADQERMNQIEQLQREKASQELALSQKQLQEERQKKLIYVLLAGVAFVLVSLSFISYRYRTKKKSHAQLDKAYAELSMTHDRLKNMQNQLVHAEKMASLGELTAGIAHEIQNPLNFVTNFSELSKELIAEINSASSEEEKAEIMSDLKSNLEKIYYHGKRADSIVKNMLQHSRSGSSEKEPTDVNKLCEEYLNLSFHGIRANDSSFNCTVEKQLDANLPRVKLIPQDFSRVMLNLFNNAFYSVRERKRISENGHSTDGKEISMSGPGLNGKVFHPNVQLVTQTLSHSVVIRVRDNGMGIPKEIKTKIFAPFFTTKPTGEGTGLGLSISRDIIVAHGGEISINDEMESGAEILIRLPIG